MSKAAEILERQHSGIEIIGSAAGEDVDNLDGGDIVLVVGAKEIGMSKIVQAARELNLPEEKLLGDWIVCIPGFTLKRYRRLQQSRLSIFSMNCFGGLMSHSLGLSCFCVYVVTHKPTPHADKLPEGYKIIHAGRALNPDLGYLGDNTGDNISRLNLYINEITALYWFWKNANNSIVGLCHYRRFFTEADDTTFAYNKILTKDAVLKILQDYDIIVVFHQGERNQHEIIEQDCGTEFTKFGETIIKKYLLQTQPDYIDAFDFVLNSTTFYKCNMFITRRNILDAYCKWLFSFIVDATEEVLRTTSLANLPWTPRRLMSFLAERMFSVWLVKNRLRIKEQNFMFITGI